jgi:putative ABC transport system ATP-binding protein
VLEVRALSKSFGSGRALLDRIDLAVAAGEWVAIVGESGSGKSTLLNIVAGLDRPDAGEVRLDGRAVDYGDDAAITLWRRKHLGFVFQAFHLLPYLSVAENVALPLALGGASATERAARAEVMLSAVGLAGFGGRKPGSLSGGEMQRVAIARALAHRPRLVLADEPTGNLDESSAGAVLDCLRDAVKGAGAAALMVTHSRIAAAQADRALHLTAGQLSLSLGRGPGRGS